MLQHLTCITHQCVKYQKLRLGNLLPTERQQLSRQQLGVLRGAVDLFDMAAKGAVGRELLQRQFAEAENGGQHVIEVVGDSAREPSNRLHLLGLAQFFLQPLPVCYVLVCPENTDDLAIAIMQRQEQSRSGSTTTDLKYGILECYRLI